MDNHEHEWPTIIDDVYGRERVAIFCERQQLVWEALGIGLSSLEASAGAATNAERSVILLLLIGGPSQLETWDPKPGAPAEVRGPFGSIATRCPGVRISEHLPRMAMRMDRLALFGRCITSRRRSMKRASSSFRQEGSAARARSIRTLARSSPGSRA